MQCCAVQSVLYILLLLCTVQWAAPTLQRQPGPEQPHSTTADDPSSTRNLPLRRDSGRLLVPTGDVQWHCTMIVRSISGTSRTGRTREGKEQRGREGGFTMYCCGFCGITDALIVQGFAHAGLWPLVSDLWWRCSTLQQSVIYTRPSARGTTLVNTLSSFSVEGEKRN